MKVLFAVLALCGYSSAQEASFYTIPATSSTEQPIAVSDGSEIVHIFYEVDNTIFHLGFDTAADSVVFPAHELTMTRYWCGSPFIQLETAAVLSDGTWICVVSGLTNSVPQSFCGGLIEGFGAQQIQQIEFDYEQDGWELKDLRIVERPGGGYFVSGTRHNGYDLGQDLFVYPCPPALQYMTGHWITAFPYMLENDTLELLVAIEDSGVVRQSVPLDCWPCEAQFTFWDVTLPEWRKTGLLLTRERSVLALSSSTVLFLNMNGGLDSLSNNLIDCCPTHWFNDRWATHPDFGIAYLYHDFWARNILHRVSLSGRLSPDYGTVGWSANAAMSVHFTPSGQLLISYADWPSTNIGLAVVPWDAPLNTHNSSPQIPTDISLSTYPNPFNSSVRIDYDLPRASDVQLSIYNILGEEVTTLFDGHAIAGTHTLSWSPNAASGVYFIKLEAATFVKTQKLLYIR